VAVNTEETPGYLYANQRSRDRHPGGLAFLLCQLLQDARGQRVRVSVIPGIRE
jgi:hypothetical protein